MARSSLCLLLGLAAIACNEGFESPSRVDSLRVLGVVADPPGGAPGGTIDLQLVYADLSAHPLMRSQYANAGEDAPQIAWIGGCHNPPGGSWYGCAELGTGGIFGTGDRFSITLPDDIIEAPRPGSLGPAFGSSYVFWAICKGELAPAPPRENTLPITCLDAEGAPRSRDYFITGYTSIYTYAGVENNNPRIVAGRFNGIDYTGRTCTSDQDCADLPNSACAAGTCNPVVPPCSSDGCRGYELQPVLSEDSAELDPTGTRPGETTPREVLWVKYYSLGGIDTHEALLHDRLAGWTNDHATIWHPPDMPSEEPVPVWAVVQDNRGGTAVWKWDVVVR